MPGESPHLQQVANSPSASHKDFAAVEPNLNLVNKSLQRCVADLFFWIWRWCQDCLNPPCGYWLPGTYTDEFPHRHARNKCIASQSTTFGKICQAQTQKNPYCKNPYYTELPLTEHQEVPSFSFFFFFDQLLRVFSLLGTLVKSRGPRNLSSLFPQKFQKSLRRLDVHIRT